MQRIRTTLQKHSEGISYLFFGACTTLVNIGLFKALNVLTGLPVLLTNSIAILASILFAYFTNRRFVFRSKAKGRERLGEFAEFFLCRLGTGVLDDVIVVLGVDSLHLWDMGVKLAANVLVIIANYVFSKCFIFKKR